MSTCHNNSEKPSTTRINKYTPPGYSLFTHCSFDLTKNKLDSYASKDCIKRFCKDLIEKTSKIINYEEKEMISLTDEENKSYKKQKVCYIWKNGFRTDDGIKKSEIIVTTQESIEELLIVFVTEDIKQQKNSIVFHNGSTYDYHFIIKEVAKEFEGQFKCLGENKENKITFSVPIKKEVDNGKAITYKLKYIDSLMSTSMSQFVDNLSKFIAKNVEIKAVNLSVSLKGLNNKLSYNFKECRKKTQLKPINELIKKFTNTYKFFNNDITSLSCY